MKPKILQDGLLRTDIRITETGEETVETLDEVRKVYSSKGGSYEALRGVSLSIRRGGFYSLTGPSGSGKSTLLHIMGMLDSPTSGKIQYLSRQVGDLPDSSLSRLRGDEIGFVFQAYNLVQRMSVLRNVMLPMSFSTKIHAAERRERAMDLLERVGMLGKENKLVLQLSGGEQQRVAIARALANRPSLIFADEPTGNLDTENSGHVMGLLREINEDGGTIVVATHDQDIARFATKHLKLRDGSLVGDEI